uniref:Uncharacterized protein n=1 Tax=Arundo donax TaxID=35708 RepID=A0A0A9CJR7_ARUDO
MRLLLSLSSANSTTTSRFFAARSASSNSSALCTRTTRSWMLRLLPLSAAGGCAFSVPETAALWKARRRRQLCAGKNLTALVLPVADGVVLLRLAVAVDLARVDRKVAVEAIGARCAQLMSLPSDRIE